MMATLRHLRDRHGIHQDIDSGWSLIEIMVALALSAVVIALVAPVLSTVTSVTSSSNSVSNGSAQIRQAVAQLSSDIGSATSTNVCFPAAVLSVPPSSTCSSIGASGATQTSGYPLVVLSYAYGTCTWYQWTVNSSKQLTQQSAAKGATSWSSAVPLISPITNLSSQTLFAFDTTNSLMNIQLVTKGANSTSLSGVTTSTQANAQSIDLQTSVSLFTSTGSSGAGTC